MATVLPSINDVSIEVGFGEELDVVNLDILPLLLVSVLNHLDVDLKHFDCLVGIHWRIV